MKKIKALEKRVLASDEKVMQIWAFANSANTIARQSIAKTIEAKKNADIGRIIAESAQAELKESLKPKNATDYYNEAVINEMRFNWCKARVSMDISLALDETLTKAWLLKGRLF